MAITLQQSIGSIADVAIKGTLTFSSNANRVLVVAAGAHQAAIGTVQLNGTNLTNYALGTTQFNENAGLWFYNAPPSGGLGTISVSAGGNGNFFVAMEFNGVAQASQPAGSAIGTGNNGTAIGTINTVTANNWIVNATYSEGSFVGTYNTGATNVSHISGQSFENSSVWYDSSVTGAVTAGTESSIIASGQRWAIASLILQPVSGITFDTAGTGSNAGLGTIQWTHTIGAGSNSIIFASTLGAYSTGSISSLTFAGTQMTRIIKGTETTADPIVAELWYLLNPPSGLGTFHGTFSVVGGVENDALSLSYFGVNQTTPILGSVTNNGSATNSNINIGRVLTGTNSWFVGFAQFDNVTGTITTGNFRGTAGATGMIVGGDNTSGTLVWSNSNALSNWDIVAAEFAPVGTGVAAPAFIGYLGLMGVGAT